MGCHALVCTLGLAGLCTVAWLALAAAIHTNVVRQQVSSTVELSLPGTSWRVPITFGAAQQVETPLASLVDASQFIVPSLNLFGFGFFVLGLSVFCSSCDRYRWRTIGFVMGCYVGQLLLFLLSKASPAWAWLGYLTCLSAYQPDAIVHFSHADPASAWWLVVPPEQRTAVWTGWLGPMGLTCLLLVGGLLWMLLAAWRLRTRDIPAPL